MTGAWSAGPLPTRPCPIPQERSVGATNGFEHEDVRYYYLQITYIE